MVNTNSTDYVNAHDVALLLGVPLIDLKAVPGIELVPLEEQTGRLLRSAVVGLCAAWGVDPERLVRTYE